jgi:hypothetical protein
VVHALIRGQARITLNEIVAQEPSWLEVEEIPEEITDSPEITILAKSYRNYSKKRSIVVSTEIMTVMKLVSGR